MPIPMPTTELEWTEDDIQLARAQGRAQAEAAYKKGHGFDPTAVDALKWLDTSQMKLKDQASATARLALLFESLDAAKNRFAELTNPTTEESDNG